MQSEDFYDIVAIIFNQIQLKLLITSKLNSYLMHYIMHCIFPILIPQTRIRGVARQCLTN